MALMTVVSGAQAAPQLKPGVLMIHNEPPAMIVVVSEVKDDLGFMGTDLQDGTHMEWDVSQFTPFIGKLTLEQ